MVGKSAPLPSNVLQRRLGWRQSQARRPQVRGAWSITPRGHWRTNVRKPSQLWGAYRCLPAFGASPFNVRQVFNGLVLQLGLALVNKRYRFQSAGFLPLRPTSSAPIRDRAVGCLAKGLHRLHKPEIPANGLTHLRSRKRGRGGALIIPPM